MSKRRSYNKIYTNPDSLFDSYSNPHNITLEDFRLITKVFFAILSHKIITEGKVFQLPNRLGSVGVYKRKTIGRGVFDYQLFKETGQKVWKKNLHSSQYAATTKWDTRPPRFDPSIPGHVFKFTPCRDHNAKLTTSIKDNNTISKYYDY